MIKQFYFKQLSLAQVICLHTVKRSNSTIWPRDRTLLVTTMPGQSGPRSNGNERVLHITQGSRTRTSPSDCLVPYLRHSRGFYSLSLCRDAPRILYCPSQIRVHINGSQRYSFTSGPLLIPFIFYLWGPSDPFSYFWTPSDSIFNLWTSSDSFSFFLFDSFWFLVLHLDSFWFLFYLWASSDLFFYLWTFLYSFF